MSRRLSIRPSLNKNFRGTRPSILAAMVLIALLPAFTRAASAETAQAEAHYEIYDRSNLVAWCIVPFDSRKRGPEARAEMLARLGLFSFAYDWRAEHIPTFDEELETLDRWGIDLKAFWFPSALNAEATAILEALERHNLRTELWVSLGGGDIATTPEERQRRIEEHADLLLPIVEAAGKIGCKVGLYNHGSWFGEPENQIAILRHLGRDNVGLVYNLHHGHDHVARFPQLLEEMIPHLLCLNLNGMAPEGDKIGKKILPIGQGEDDLDLLKTIAESDYRGPIGILGHTMDDAEETLKDNLAGLEWAVGKLTGKAPQAPKPVPHTEKKTRTGGVHSLSPAFGMALAQGVVKEGSESFRNPPITVECLARLHGAASYNILVSCDTKASGSHWEIFTEAGSGTLSLYIPGANPDHLRTSTFLCDGQWHWIGLHLGEEEARLFVDGESVGETGLEWKATPKVPGGLAIGQLVEGVFGCEGEVDEVRISRGIVPVESPREAPLLWKDTTLALWNFEDLSPVAELPAEPEVEDASARAALPEFQVLPAARPEELTPASESPVGAPFIEWRRSHGDTGNTRFSSLDQIDRTNVDRLQVAWTYHSKDGEGNIQCNPIVVEGILYAPTVGENVVAIEARNGEEIWRFDLEGRPAFRGLLYWRGNETASPRIFLSAGQDLWALDPADGKPIESFGQGGKVEAGEVRVPGAVFDNVLVIPGYAKDVFGYDALTGERLWTFHTVPVEGEYGADTWSHPGQGANCWGGMALDEERGIAYISTGSPKPNFDGVEYQGQNLFANCVIALEAKTGERLWHFQEIRHDIWDLDIPAPPNLVSVTREGKRVDAVAQVTKLGNTLLLDRVTGKPLFPFRLRKAPTSKLPGERTWPYQPDPELPEPFAKRVFGPEDVTDLSDEAETFVRNQIASANYGWFEPFEENRPTVFFAIHGGAEWTGAAVDPRKGLLYVSANEIPWNITVFRQEEIQRDPNAPPTPGQAVYQVHCIQCHGPNREGVGMAPPLHSLGRRMNEEKVIDLLKNGRNAMPAATALTEEDRRVLLDFLFLRDLDASQTVSSHPPGPPKYTFNGYNRLKDEEGYPGSKPPWGTLNCLDLNTGEKVWSVPLGVYPELEEWGITDTGAENFGGATLTAGGLVFIAGSPDERIRAFDADTGEMLWEHPLPWGGYAPPAVYQVDGKQFVVIAATGGGKLGGPMGDAYVAFALPEN
jgi:quinoprotein glucose dehydrogenase